MARPTQFDPLPRQGLCAVELVDPVTGARVFEGLAVKAFDEQNRRLSREPFLNRSGRFVWLRPGVQWPARIDVQPARGAPYLPGAYPIAPLDAPSAGESEQAGEPRPRDRLLRIMLSPSRIHPLEGVTAIRGAVRARNSDGQHVPVGGAIVQMRWFDGQDWNPARVDPDAGSRSTAVVTDDDGEFAAFLPGHDPRFDPEPGMTHVRIEVTRWLGRAWVTRWTDENDDDPARRGGLPKGGLIRAGFLYPTPAAVSWDHL